MTYDYKQFRRRKLPHIHSPGATLFVTFRLAGSIPKSVLQKWKSKKIWIENEIERTRKDDSQVKTIGDKERRKRLLDFHRQTFIELETILHEASNGPTWLKDERIAEIVAESLHHRDGEVYRLDAFCVMSNHVHVVFKPFLGERDLTEIRFTNPLRIESAEPPLNVIMHSLKSYTAQVANKQLKRSGTFWEEESYDHEVRDDAEFFRIVKYVLQNPVKAGLVSDWRNWRWNWKRETIPL